MSLKKRNQTQCSNIIYRLELLRERVKSWDEVARKLGIHKRTILRWRKTRRVSDSYIRLVDELLRKDYNI